MGTSNTSPLHPLEGRGRRLKKLSIFLTLISLVYLPFSFVKTTQEIQKTYKASMINRGSLLQENKTMCVWPMLQSGGTDSQRVSSLIWSLVWLKKMSRACSGLAGTVPVCWSYWPGLLAHCYSAGPNVLKLVSWAWLVYSCTCRPFPNRKKSPCLDWWKVVGNIKFQLCSAWL